MSEPLSHEDQSPAAGFQIDQEGTELMELVLGAIQPDDLAAPYVDEANPGADGLLTAEDKAKLDGIENEATADQTAVEIVALIDADATAEGTLKTALGLGTAAAAAATDFATAAQGALAATAIQPPSISTVAITAGAIATPLDSNHRTLQLTADVAAGWTAPLPAGGNAATQVYWSSLDILPPASGGPFALSIPSTWLCLGPLDTIALAVGDDPITVTLRSWGASGVAYSASQSSLPA